MHYYYNNNDNTMSVTNENVDKTLVNTPRTQIYINVRPRNKLAKPN